MKRGRNFESNALTYEAARKIKSNWAETLLIGDLALDPYTIHGHDGILDSDGQIANDPTVEILAKASVLAGDSGYDMVAPSDMMDGRVSIIKGTWIQPICCIRVFWLIPLNFAPLIMDLLEKQSVVQLKPRLINLHIN